MAKQKRYPREKWIEEKPFDVADWGDKPLPYPNGLFSSERELAEITEQVKDWPLPSPKPKD